MKPNSRKNETNQTDKARLPGNESSPSQPQDSISHTTSKPGDNSTDNAAAHQNGENTNEVTRTAEGRPGTFGIDDF